MPQANTPTSEPFISIRPIEFEQDYDLLMALLTPSDRLRINTLQSAIEQGDGFVFVAVKNQQVIGWVVVHTRYREDQGWVVDGNTVRFQSGENAYLEYLEVEAEMRSKGIGRRLLSAAEEATRQIGKRVLWLHTGEQNEGAHRFYKREGWRHHVTVYPVWRDRSPMRVYRKEISRDTSHCK